MVHEPDAPVVLVAYDLLEEGGAGLRERPLAERRARLEARLAGRLGLKPDVTAPGISIVSAKADSVSGYVSKSGTSMAAPFVSGALALLRGAGLSRGPPEMGLSSTNRGAERPLRQHG